MEEGGGGGGGGGRGGGRGEGGGRRKEEGREHGKTCSTKEAKKIIIDFAAKTNGRNNSTLPHWVLLWCRVQEEWEEWSGGAYLSERSGHLFLSFSVIFPSE